MLHMLEIKRINEMKCAEHRNRNGKHYEKQIYTNTYKMVHLLSL